MKIGVVVFPGSNCDHDCQYIFKDVLGQYVEMIWHKETLLAGSMRSCCRRVFLRGLFADRCHRAVFSGDGSREGLCE
jgi:phosphoribosylformylglycinamidine (FGAM) synthase-like amidotransferase family enzyme